MNNKPYLMVKYLDTLSNDEVKNLEQISGLPQDRWEIKFDELDSDTKDKFGKAVFYCPVTDVWIQYDRDESTTLVIINAKIYYME